MLKDKKILDACCGSRMFWFNKQNKNTVYMDIRELEDTLCDGRKLEVKPDIIADFRNIPFEDNSFHMVVFDPPHLLNVGANSWLCKKYGRLSKNWKEDIQKGFEECLRVLKPCGTLIFKWSECQIPFKELLAAIKKEPLIYHKNNKTYFLVFMKEGA